MRTASRRARRPDRDTGTGSSPVHRGSARCGSCHPVETRLVQSKPRRRVPADVDRTSSRNVTLLFLIVGIVNDGWSAAISRITLPPTSSPLDPSFDELPPGGRDGSGRTASVMGRRAPAYDTVIEWGMPPGELCLVPRDRSASGDVRMGIVAYDLVARQGCRVDRPRPSFCHNASIRPDEPSSGSGRAGTRLPS